MAGLVDSKTSRYRNTPRENGYIMEDDLMIYPHNSDVRTVVSSAEEGRMDRVASRIYNNPLLAWVIARRNGIIDPTTVPAGRVLFCPSVQRIYAKGGPLNT